ncbi:ethyl tert-butyl ether degradation EthD [Roseibium sp. TrichSKD4]|jgi:uncharacterized protein (TIGR02118 family)|uniref:EthD family reductase n=1 Tax=Roseibium sp. TrichSKD4 TaxID=744980 RepID=UPI0001E5714B|nr:EthD family reductase [Roseibium sp. TrichSKD4]EFO28951.1 ethyl tert-butyl ether degradation EthD [Roseibium sp. TrichSKD4]
MTVSLQVIYQATEGSRFDHDYYENTHIPLMHQHMGAGILSTVVVKGVAGARGTPAKFHAIATAVFKDQASLEEAMKAAGPVLADIPNYTDVQPEVLIGDVVG